MGKNSSESPSLFRRRGSLRSMEEVSGSAQSSCRSRLFFHGEVSDEIEAAASHFLDSCFRCKTHLHQGDDIYMYRGDTPFCSEECREEQIEIDEAEERRRLKSKKKMMMVGGSTAASSSSSSRSREIHVRAAAGAVVAG